MSKYLLLLIAFLFSSCGTTCYFGSEKGCCRPSLALLPIVDSTICANLEWAIADELGTRLERKLEGEGNFKIIPKSYVTPFAQGLSSEQLFNRDLTSFSCLPVDSYAVVVEIAAYDRLPCDTERPNSLKPHNARGCKEEIRAQLKLRVVKLDEGCPVLVLQETINSCQPLPYDNECIDYMENGWGSPGYVSTPISVANQKLVDELSNRITKYVLLCEEAR